MMTGALVIAHLGEDNWPQWDNVSRSRVKMADMLRLELGIPRWR